MPLSDLGMIYNQVSNWPPISQAKLNVYITISLNENVTLTTHLHNPVFNGLTRAEHAARTGERIGAYRNLVEKPE
jgi:hypothetical protein